MHYDADFLHDRQRSLTREWLLTDGAGGYASSTLLGCGTRRYHGLWVPALKPPVDRRVVLSHFEERLITPHGESWLSTTEYGAGFYPDGSPLAVRFDLDPLPRLMSRVDGVEVDREVLLLEGGAGVCLTYRVRAGGPWTLALAPMLAMRSMHHLVHHHAEFHAEAMPGDYGVRCLTSAMRGVFMWISSLAPAEYTGGRAAPVIDLAVAPTWYFGVLRRVERARGFDHFEDLLAPCRWTIRGDGPTTWHVFCSFDPPRPVDVAAARKRLMARQVELAVYAGSPKDKRVARLVRAADAFLVRRRVGGEDLATVIAGYHWFGDWGRDTMIALPGLAMETGRLDVAEHVLGAFAAQASEGMIPNCFHEETGVAEYNTVDASLWFIQAAAAFMRAGGDTDFLRRRLWPVVTQIIDKYQHGTRFGIRADTDGLITAGSVETQLTWMDARVAGRPVTPRYGKAVEISALWLSGIGLAREMAAKIGHAPPPAAVDLDRARAAFEELFWNEGAQALYDCVLPDGRKDALIRPNQIFAAGLPHAPLSARHARAVVRTVRERLLTPRGLRTLAPGGPSYRGRYAGGPDERDGAYHQGTAWPWLLGPYVDAIFATEEPRDARTEATHVLEGLLDAMEEAGLGQISEVYDGNLPQQPGGCIAQAWSVAAAVHIWRVLESSESASR
jgi:predicted glycogen debranching enzyme